MKNNPIRSAIGFLLIGIMCAVASEGCKTKSMAITHTIYSPLLINNFKHDTVRVVEKHMTQAEYRKYLQDFYKGNFDEMFAPKFMRLESIIANQAKSIEAFANYQQQTRHRTDSIAHERNYYRDLWATNMNKSLSYQKQLIALQKALIKQEQEDRISQAQQIKTNTIMSIAALLGTFVIAIALFLLYYKVNKLYKTYNPNA